ncbi:MAG: tetratricopeptide repeat protein [Acidobacteria bacterium]|nr:tetratricopeptide repeat protein [Acidobacteriota bacterium]
MRQFTQLIENESAVTPNDLHALMASLSGPSAYGQLSNAQADAKDEAQQIAFDAMEARTVAQARKLAKRALKLDADCVDALVLLTDLDTRTPLEKIEGLQNAVAAGERSLGDKFIRENKGHFWMLLETRPYMRALERLGGMLHSHGDRLGAIKTYEMMLKLNPNDNQGVRDPLLGLYLETDDLEGAGRLLKKYKGDASANFAWARVLERFLSNDRDGANASLKRALKANRHVELYLTEQRALPKRLPEMYSTGSEEEAVLCLNYLGRAWASHKAAAVWLSDRPTNDRRDPRTPSCSSD